MTLRTSISVAATALAAAATSGLLLAPPSSAAAPVSETFTDSFVITDFCGTGLKIQVDAVIRARSQFVSRGAGLPYFRQNGVSETTFTNPKTGASVTEIARVLEKDLKITYDADGLATLLVLATGNSTLYDDSTGKAVGRNPGQVRFELLIDDGGTPDFFDDDIVTDLGLVKGSTGRSDDFCEATLPVLG